MWKTGRLEFTASFIKLEIHLPRLEMSIWVKLAKAYQVCPESPSEAQTLKCKFKGRLYFLSEIYIKI